MRAHTASFPQCLELASLIRDLPQGKLAGIIRSIRKLQRLRNVDIQDLLHWLIPWFFFIQHCRLPKKAVSVVLNKIAQGLKVSYFPEQITLSRLPVWNSPQMLMLVSSIFVECYLGQFKSVMARKHANDGKWIVYAHAWAHNLALLSVPSVKTISHFYLIQQLAFCENFACLPSGFECYINNYCEEMSRF